LTLMIIVANAFGMAMIVPQVLKIRRSRVLAGVSPAWVGIGVAMNLWWIVYAIQGALWGILPVSAFTFVMYTVMARLYINIGGRTAQRAIAKSGLIAGLAPLPILIFGGWVATGVTIGLAYGLQLTPAVVSAFRSESIEGISAWTWAIAWFEAAVWLAYGIAIIDVALLFGGTSGVFLSTLILMRLAWARRQHNATTALGPEPIRVT